MAEVKTQAVITEEQAQLFERAQKTRIDLHHIGHSVALADLCSANKREYLILKTYRERRKQQIEADAENQLVGSTVCKKVA